MARYGYARGRHGAPRNAKGQFVKGPSRKSRKTKKATSRKRPKGCPPCAKKKASRRAKGRRRNARGQFA